MKNILPSHPAKLATKLLAASLLLAAALPAAQLSYHRATPTPGSNDVANLVGATRDRDNIGGDGVNDGDGNDPATYISGIDRPHQGQTFTTGANPAGYQVNAIWLRHAGYAANANGTWWCSPVGSSLTLRVTRPSAAGTFAFALATETLTTTGSEPGAPNALTPLAVRTSTPNGTGLWLRFAFTSPVTLFPNSTYGFDVAAHNSEFFFETLGLRNTPGSDPYAGGSAYTGSTTGATDDTLNPLAGDRVFLVELSPAIDVARNGSDVFLAWAQLPGAVRQIEIYRNHSADPEGRTRIATLMTAQTSYLEKAPDETATYWYWLLVTSLDGKTETIGPVRTPAAKVWSP